MADENSKIDVTDTKEKDDKELSPQEIEAKKKAEAEQAKADMDEHVQELIKSKKYYLPIK